MNLDRPARQHVRDEVADSEVLIQRQVGPAKGPTARDLALHTGLGSIDSAEQLGGAFALRVGVNGIQNIRGSHIAFRNVSDIGRLCAVYRARTGQQELFCAVSGGEFQDTFGASNHSRKHLQRILQRLLASRIASCVDDETVGSFRKRKITNIAKTEVHGGI